MSIMSVICYLKTNVFFAILVALRHYAFVGTAEKELCRSEIHHHLSV